MKVILACIDLSPISESVIRTAAALAKGMSADLHLLHVSGGDIVIRHFGPQAGYTETAGPGPHAPADVNIAEERLKHSEQSIATLAERLRLGGVRVFTHVLEGAELVRILQETDRLKPDLIVVGSHGRGLAYHLLAGSTTQGLLQKAKCPVVVVPRPGQ